MDTPIAPLTAGVGTRIIPSTSRAPVRSAGTCHVTSLSRLAAAYWRYGLGLLHAWAVITSNGDHRFTSNWRFGMRLGCFSRGTNFSSNRPRYLTRTLKGH